MQNVLLPTDEEVENQIRPTPTREKQGNTVQMNKKARVLVAYLGFKKMDGARITDEERKSIHSYFWNLKTWVEKRRL